MGQYHRVALAPLTATLDTADRVLDWIEGHPVTFGYLLTILGWASTGLLTAWKKPKTPEEYERLSQKSAAFWKAVGAIFVDVPKLRQALHEYRNGYIPRAERVTLPDGLPAIKGDDHVAGR